MVMVTRRTGVDEGKRMIVVDSVLSSGTVRSLITVSKDLEKYIKRFNFFSRYDIDVVANKSIFNIPVLSIILPFAWITGADVYVGELDKNFARSMDALQKKYQRIYPKAPFKTKLVVDELVENEYAQDGIALLFSGGLDSTYSLFSNKDLKPRLIMLFGVPDIPLSNIEFQELVKTEYSNFAEREGLKINFIQSNALEILNGGRVNHLFYKFKGEFEGDFWQGLGYSFGHIGQVAPLSIGRFNRLLVAAHRDETQAYALREHPDAASPVTDEVITWANIQVKHDGCIHRHEKVFALKKYLNEQRIKLRVCWLPSDQLLLLDALNCNACEKCLRTISPLLLAGIDPNKCGFNVDDSTLNLVRTLFDHKKCTQSHITLWWKPLQKMIPEKIEGDLYGSKQFFEWFKTINLDLLARHSKKSLLSIIYHKFPYSISNLLKKILYDTRKHEPWWLLRKINKNVNSSKEKIE